ncbi:hypothetical protein, partial [Pseudomonas veronii]|uniref:hypothetical protein n=1 Tax=Pseudomonas veronii TaxID=76761 RepID=UPI001CC21C21
SFYLLTDRHSGLPQSLTIVGCIGHHAGLYCRAFLASRQQYLLFLATRLGKVVSADRCTSLKPPLLNVPL